MKTPIIIIAIAAVLLAAVFMFAGLILGEASAQTPEPPPLYSAESFESITIDWVEFMLSQNITPVTELSECPGYSAWGGNDWWNTHPSRAWLREFSECDPSYVKWFTKEWEYPIEELAARIDAQTGMEPSCEVFTAVAYDVSGVYPPTASTDYRDCNEQVEIDVIYFNSQDRDATDPLLVRKSLMWMPWMGVCLDAAYLFLEYSAGQTGIPQMDWAPIASTLCSILAVDSIHTMGAACTRLQVASQKHWSLAGIKVKSNPKESMQHQVYAQAYKAMSIPICAAALASDDPDEPDDPVAYATPPLDDVAYTETYTETTTITATPCYDEYCQEMPLYPPIPPSVTPIYENVTPYPDDMPDTPSPDDVLPTYEPSGTPWPEDPCEYMYCVYTTTVPISTTMPITSTPIPTATPAPTATPIGDAGDSGYLGDPGVAGEPAPTEEAAPTTWSECPNYEYWKTPWYDSPEHAEYAHRKDENPCEPPPGELIGEAGGSHWQYTEEQVFAMPEDGHSWISAIVFVEGFSKPFYGVSYDGYRRTPETVFIVDDQIQRLSEMNELTIATMGARFPGWQYFLECIEQIIYPAVFDANLESHMAAMVFCAPVMASTSREAFCAWNDAQMVAIVAKLKLAKTTEAEKITLWAKLNKHGLIMAGICADY